MQKQHIVEVRGHVSYSKTGMPEWIPAHKMRENTRVRKRHLHRLEQEIKGLKELEHM